MLASPIQIEWQVIPASSRRRDYMSEEDLERCKRDPEELDDPDAFVDEALLFECWMPDRISNTPAYLLTAHTETIPIEREHEIFDSFNALDVGKEFPHPFLFPQAEVLFFGPLEGTLVMTADGPRMTFSFDVLWSGLLLCMRKAGLRGNQFMRREVIEFVTILRALDPSTVQRVLDAISSITLQWQEVGRATIALKRVSTDARGDVDNILWLRLLSGHGTIEKSQILRLLAINHTTLWNYSQRYNLKSLSHPNQLRGSFDVRDVRTKLIRPLLHARQEDWHRQLILQKCSHYDLRPPDLLDLL